METWSKRQLKLTSYGQTGQPWLAHAVHEFRRPRIAERLITDRPIFCLWIVRTIVCGGRLRLA